MPFPESGLHRFVFKMSGRRGIEFLNSRHHVAATNRKVNTADERGKVGGQKRNGVSDFDVLSTSPERDACFVRLLLLRSRFAILITDRPAWCHLIDSNSVRAKLAGQYAKADRPARVCRSRRHPVTDGTAWRIRC